MQDEREIYVPITSPISESSQTNPSVIPDITNELDQPSEQLLEYPDYAVYAINPPAVDYEIEYPEFPDYSTYSVNSPVRIAALSSLYQGARTYSAQTEEIEATPIVSCDTDTLEQDLELSDTNDGPITDIHYEIDSDNESVCSAKTVKYPTSTPDTPDTPDTPEPTEPCTSISTQLVIHPQDQNNGYDNFPHEDSEPTYEQEEPRSRSYRFTSTTTTVSTTKTISADCHIQWHSFLYELK